MKKFYSVKLRQYRENVPVELAKHLLKKESKLIKYLDSKGALAFKYFKKQYRLNLYGEEKFLMLGKMQYPNIFDNKGRMGFMELYISYRIKQSMSLAKGST